MNFTGLPLTLDSSLQGAEQTDKDILDIALETVRTHLGMDVAYLSEFVGDRSVFRAVSAPGMEALIKAEDSVGLDEVYCQHILAGRLPRLISDTADHPLALEIPITQQVPIGSHVSVPVYRADGSVYGMFCCLSPQPNPTLNTRDLDVMETFAAIATRELDATLRRRSERARMSQRLDEAMGPEGVEIVLQPIVDLSTRRISGFEALSRFTGEPYRSPDQWFADALAIGRQIELEAYVVSKALSLLPELPEGTSISVNASPGTVASGILAGLAAASDPSRITIELTEHAIVENFDRVSQELDRLRQLGARVAADDVGAGHSGLTQLLRLRPDVIKLDIELVRGIDSNSAKQALVMGMMYFARDIGARIVAEGIETDEEREALRTLGVHQGQGYHLGKPMSLARVRDWMSLWEEVAGEPAVLGRLALNG
ncbi:EAL domain-containing protein [Pseudoroseicyclus sp. CXY001]|uniref:sensor domain-containing phosphodiesterase n=1 Tax=Pseudoroseicyclus sp. CXY001 TaxID=3242492 RepID=UPI003570E22C